MELITVDKKTLIETITRNREEHREMFLKAQKRFRKAVIKALDERLEQARAGKQVELLIRLPEPVDYTYSYDTALAMLDWEVEDTVQLSQHDFERYVQNDWEWKQHWAANTGSYLAQ
jgi:hypothetical protein